MKMIETLDFPLLFDKALQFPNSGKIKVSCNNLVYLDIDDKYINTLFPLLLFDGIKKPGYFGKDGVGAHISIIYPEDKILFRAEDIGKAHHFAIQNVFRAKIHSKIYYGLLVYSASLQELRKKYNLSEKLFFKGYALGFHITIGVQQFTSQSGHANSG